jgi:SAM-dependent methyltransferase
MWASLAAVRDSWLRSQAVAARTGKAVYGKSAGEVRAGATVAGGVTEAFEANCLVCGRWGTHRKERPSIRETYACAHCKSTLRYRGQAEAMIRCFGKPGTRSIAELVRQDRFRSLAIYEPGVAGPFRRFLRGLPLYKQSYYWEGVAEELSGKTDIKNQNLMDLTFPDNSFDIVITSDIFEHIRRPYVAFAEVCRVLRKGGMHIFSVPLIAPMPPATVYRIDTSGGEDILLEPAHYHGSPLTGRSLVYTDFGADMMEELERIGLHTLATELDLPFVDLRRLLTFASTKV